MEVGDPNLGPETSREIELGLDAGLWNDRIGVELACFNQVTKDALVFKRFPPSMGFDRTQVANIGELKHGLGDGDPRHHHRGDHSDWEANLQLSTSENVVTSLGGSRRSPAATAHVSSTAIPRPASGRVIDSWDPVTRKHKAVDTLVYRGDATPKWRGALGTAVRLFDNVTIRGLAEFATGRRCG